MTKKEKIFSTLSEQDQKKVLEIISLERAEWAKELTPIPDRFGLRRLPRENPNDPNSRFLSEFKTDKHTYTIIGEEGIGFERYTAFQKRTIQRAFARDFQSLYNELNDIKMSIAGEQNVAKMRSDAILHITGIQDAIADFGNEQFEASMWLCTLFILREDENVTEYSEKIAEEKIRDWSQQGFSELDFFLLSGSMVAGYGKAYQDLMQRSRSARERYLAATLTLGKERTAERAEKSNAPTSGGK